jgi:hypothetical protein
MELRVLLVQAAARPCRARLPLPHTATASLVTVGLTVKVDGATHTGLAGGFAPPDGPQGSESLLAAVRAAGAAFSDHVGSTPFEIWREVHGALGGAAPQGSPEGPGQAFGVALVERALVDAACRAAGLSLREALRADILGFRPGTVHPELAGWEAASALPAEPPATLRVRHAVRSDTTLRTEPGPAATGDAPASLEDALERFGLSSLLLRLSGDPRADARRLFDVALLLAGRRLHEVTLDAGEQYPDLSELGRVLDALATTPEGEALLNRLLCVEDPLPRERAFDPALTAPFAAFPFPVVLCRAERGLADFPRALEHGYRGVSARSSRGVFRSLLHRGLCAAHGAFQLAGDDACVPLLPLHQDLALLTVLGCEHAERSGHVHFRGLDHLGELERAVALAHHSELYRRGPGGIFLRVERGELDVARLGAEPGFASAAAHAAEG